MVKLSPTEEILNTPFTVGDFWSWAYSNILSNTNRSVFAEFLVASALNVLDQPRIEWNAYDLSYREHRIEVKASAYLQSWSQTQLSKIRFDIGQKRAWDADTNISASNPLRSALIYIFCLFTEQDRSVVNVLNIAKWQFFILPTRDLEKKFEQQKRVSLTALEELSAPISYEQIKVTVDELIMLIDSGN